MTVMPMTYVEAPTASPAKFGILSAAHVVDDSDPHTGYGFEYVPDFCGPAELSVAMCLPGGTVGNVSGGTNTTRVLTLNFNSAPAGSHPIIVVWGDGGRSSVNSGTVATHTYTANGTYQVSVSGANGWRASGSVVVTNGTATPITAMQGVAPKTVTDGLDLVIADPFVVYTLSSCRTVGVRDAIDRARKSLGTGEGRAIEEWLGVRLDAEATTIGGAGLTAVAALALIEQYIACNYGGVGTIHMDRLIATILLSDNVLHTEGDTLLTGLGNVVSAGCYHPGATLTSGWIYATGTVVLRRGPVFTPSDAIVDHATNQQYALAERPYSGAWECFAVKAAVNPSLGRSVQSAPTSGDGSDVETGADTVEGPSGAWFPPPGVLRNVQITVVSGSVEINGNETSAPHEVNFDADTGEDLTPPTITANASGDRAVVTWVVGA